MNDTSSITQTKRMTRSILAALITSTLLFAPLAHASIDKSEAVSKYATHEVELFITEAILVNGALYAAKLVWLPPSMVSLCMGRSVYNCEEVRYMQTQLHQQKIASMTSTLKEKIADDIEENIPPTALVEWVGVQEPRYARNASRMLNAISELPAIKILMERFKQYPSITRSLEPLHVHYSIHATVGYEPWDEYHHYRVISIESNVNDTKKQSD